MGGVGIWQIVLVLIIVLVIFGPSRIPGLGKSLGEAIKGFKKGIGDDEIDVTSTAKSEQVPSSAQQSSTEPTKDKNKEETKTPS